MLVSDEEIDRASLYDAKEISLKMNSPEGYRLCIGLLVDSFCLLCSHTLNLSAIHYKPYNVGVAVSAVVLLRMFAFLI